MNTTVSVIDTGAKMPVCCHYAGSSCGTLAEKGGLDERDEHV